MLGRLLHLGSGVSANSQPQPGTGATSRPILSLESVQEDIHTRNLLFPDAHAIHLHRNDQVFPLSTAPATPSASAANAFDYGEDFDLDVRDVRVIVLQDALGPANASLLFDSHPSPESPVERSPVRKEARRPPLSPRGDAASQAHASRPVACQPESPQHRQGAFDRRSSVHSRSQSYTETDAQRAAREYREELATFSSCIFGNSELMAYKGTSTKVHVMPSDTRPPDHSSSVFGDGRSSIGRSSGRSSKLSQSLSSQAVSPTIGPPPVPQHGTVSRSVDKKKVLITRLFPVNLPADDADASVLPQSRFTDDNPTFPFPGPGEDPSPKKSQPKQRRTPMYAVVLVVQLPRSSSRMSSAAPLRSIFRECGSYNDQDLFSSSYNSAKAGWVMSGSGNCGDVTDSSYSIDIEDRIDSLTQHWDIIMRTLTHLQSMVANTLHSMLKQADLASPGPGASPAASSVVSRTPSMSDRRGLDAVRPKPPKGMTKLVSLLPNCLADDSHIASEVAFARSRVIMGLGAARVVTGQGRWGIWRDEAIWASRWASARDHGQFFYNLLTGFLAVHTDWLQALCGPSYRMRMAAARHSKNEEDLSLPARTIIVSDDKMAARRLVFLLSAFLPANQQMASARTHRPSTSASLSGYSYSPPTFVVPILREESLRRKINRRSGLRRASHSRTASQSARGSTVPTQLAQLSMERNQHQRRASDAASVRTASLAMPGQDLWGRKTSAATTTTIMPETTTPHFSSAQQQRDGHRRRRPGSSGSVAADDLKRSLKRGESSGAGSVTTAGARPPSQGLRWGNLVSGLWSPRRRDSLDDDTAGPGMEYRSPVKPSFSRPDKLFDMVQETSLVEEPGASVLSRKAHEPGARSFGISRHDGPPGQGSFASADRTPDPSGAFESPVKTSINAEDGVIDVDVPFPDYIASFESAISSPSSSGYLSTPGLPGSLDFLEQSGRFAIDGDLPLNVAGWLNRFHPDFALQALPPQENLLDKVKASLRAEPTPLPGCASRNETSERWVDVSSVIVADTTSNSITRHVYRRLMKPKAKKPGPSAAVSNSNGKIPLTPFVLPYECHFEEDWIEEDITTSNTALREAIERLINLTPDTSKGSSANSSQTPSDSRRNTESARTVPDAVSETTQMADTPLDVPRVQCKAVILSTLEDMVRDAIDSRDTDGEGRSVSQKQGRQGHNLLRETLRQWATSLEAAE